VGAPEPTPRKVGNGAIASAAADISSGVVYAASGFQRDIRLFFGFDHSSSTGSFFMNSGVEVSGTISSGLLVGSEFTHPIIITDARATATMLSRDIMVSEQRSGPGKVC